MKLCFLGKNSGKKFLTQIWVFGSFFAPPRLFTPPGGKGVNFFTKISQNRFWVMKLSFLGKNRGKNFLTQIWAFGSKKFSTGPQLSEYVWVVCRNTKGTCLKSVSKTPTFRFFRDFQPLKRLLHTSSQMANFGQFLAKMGETEFFSKKRLKHFFRLYKP